MSEADPHLSDTLVIVNLVEDYLYSHPREERQARARALVWQLEDWEDEEDE